MMPNVSRSLLVLTAFLNVKFTAIDLRYRPKTRMSTWLFCGLYLTASIAGQDQLHASDRLNWSTRMGPTLNSHVLDADAVGLPTEWSEEPKTNIAWKLELEGFGHSAPVIGHDLIWLTAATADGKQQYVYCIEQKTGKILHHKLLFENPEPEPLGNGVNTYASPTCALEDDAVYVHFGTYGTAKLNPETLEVVWRRSVGAEER